jgi:mannose-6-phosphate isomerase-like protein (cupin superfamily)
MADWTQKNLMSVDNAAAGYGLEGGFEARFAAGDLEADDTGVGHQVLPAGARSPFAHRHDQAEEVYVVLSGAGRMKLDDAVIEVSRLDAIRVAPKVARAFEAGDEGLEILVFGPRHKGDGEILKEDVWAQ